MGFAKPRLNLLFKGTTGDPAGEDTAVENKRDGAAMHTDEDKDVEQEEDGAGEQVVDERTAEQEEDAAGGQVDFERRDELKKDGTFKQRIEDRVAAKVTDRSDILVVDEGTAEEEDGTAGYPKSLLIVDGLLDLLIYS